MINSNGLPSQGMFDIRLSNMDIGDALHKLSEISDITVSVEQRETLVQASQILTDLADNYFVVQHNVVFNPTHQGGFLFDENGNVVPSLPVDSLYTAKKALDYAKEEGV